MYITLAKVCKSADVTESKPYTWASCEQRKENVGWRRGPLARANGMTILGKGENIPSMDTQH